MSNIWQSCLGKAVSAWIRTSHRGIRLPAADDTAGVTCHEELLCAFLLLWFFCLWWSELKNACPPWCSAASRLPPITPSPGNAAHRQQHTRCRKDDCHPQVTERPRPLLAAWGLQSCILHRKVCLGGNPDAVGTVTPAAAGERTLCVTAAPENVHAARRGDEDPFFVPRCASCCVCRLHPLAAAVGERRSISSPTSTPDGHPLLQGPRPSRYISVSGMATVGVFAVSTSTSVTAEPSKALVQPVEKEVKMYLMNFFLP